MKGYHQPYIAVLPSLTVNSLHPQRWAKIIFLLIAIAFLKNIFKPFVIYLKWKLKPAMSYHITSCLQVVCSCLLQPFWPNVNMHDSIFIYSIYNRYQFLAISDSCVYIRICCFKFHECMLSIIRHSVVAYCY